MPKKTERQKKNSVVTYNKKTRSIKRKSTSNYSNEFINITSHQLRTPLATIQSSIDLLELYIKRENTARQLQVLNKIKKSVMQLRDIIENITELYKKKKQKLNVQKIYLRKFINDLIEEIIVDASEKHLINVNIEYPEQFIYADEFALKQILVNLLTNSIKFSPEGGQIRLNVKRNDKHLEISIRDEGIGIDENDIKNLFKPFFRAKNASEIPGIGLGLAIIKKLIDLHKGKIKCYSSLGKGTEFQIFLPLIYEKNIDNRR